MPLLATSLLIALLSLAITSEARLRTCKARNLPAIEVFGLEIVNLSSKEQRGFEAWDQPLDSNLPLKFKPLDFCNFTITYTHPGQNDRIHVYIWLPFDDWNGRFLGQGGGGWSAGGDGALASGVALGYAAANTDAGHSLYGNFDDLLGNAHKWAMLSPGNINWVLLQDFASRALDDLPKIAKQVIKGFYGEEPKHSYWSGCSTGGRQGLMSAQRFPTNYNGILAVAPAINWASFVPAEYWPQIMMRKFNYYPPPHELEAIRKAAIESCDVLDGVKDGVISAPGLCAFDAQSVVGSTFYLDGEERVVTSAAADIANAIWEGPIQDGKREWFGNTHETSFGGMSPFMGIPDGLAMTICAAGGKNCEGYSFPISPNWIQYFVEKDPKFDVLQMDESDFFEALHRSRNEYSSIMDTSDPDLSGFKASGGKMITWHGLADELIFPNGSSNYYERVLALDPGAREFYRYFEAPGVQHCTGGIGAFPSHALDSLVAWVEKGIAPDTLDAASISRDKSEAVRSRPLCPYPQVAAYTGGDPDEASSFRCAESFDAFSEQRGPHTEL
ncbi:hypothetical protein LTR36_008847 [Oleoguttula mirabilis]|uniref:Carboxylic ester hydrolase n=1 Tax=Oleoguttula mirabilis TaxID=1507867 RepID=A0AAV9J794_9PEZI|nr:hypothetical protein LTR36_008847 [Oleoguttula mirabilis]